MARMGRPPADIHSIVRYLIKHGPQPAKALIQAAARGELPVSSSSIRNHLMSLSSKGWVAQRMERGDYYPARDPETGDQLRVEVLSPDEWQAVQALRGAA